MAPKSESGFVSRSGSGTGDVVVDAIGGDPDAIDTLWRLSAPWLGAVVLAYLPAEEELEDVLQEVAVAMVAQISTLRDANAFAPWLRSIALNTVRRAGRRASRRRGKPSRPAEGAGRRTDPPHDLAAAVELLQRLPEHAREVLLLRAARGLSQSQIAEVLDVPVRTVETRLRRARRALRALVDDSTTEREPLRSKK